jgi:hypothetical protein
MWIIAVQVCAYVALRMPMPDGQRELMFSRLVLLPDRVLAGEWWRLLSFIFLPPFGNPLFDFFAWYLLYMMGTSLERFWGTFRYNLFLWIWWLATIAVALTLRNMPATNYGLQQSVFLAFAFLNPEFTLMLFFVLPVQIRYLAWLRWFFIVVAIATGTNGERLETLAAIANFLIFFGPELKDRLFRGTRRMQREAARVAQREAPYTHKCATCGITDREAPNLEFRYCSKCEGQLCYCSDHLRSHEHVQRTAASKG